MHNALFPFVNSFTPRVIDMWLLHAISNCSQKLTRNENVTDENLQQEYWYTTKINKWKVQWGGNLTVYITGCLWMGQLESSVVMRHPQEKKYSITIICFDDHCWDACVLTHSKCTRNYVPCQERFSWLWTWVWLPVASTVFPGWYVGNSWTDWKDWCCGRHHFKRKTFNPSLYRLLKDYNIVTGELSQCFSTKLLEIRVI